MSITNARRICIARVNIANIFGITATHTRNDQLNPCGSIIKSQQAIFHFQTYVVSDVTLSPAIYKFKKYKVKKCLLYHRNSSILLSILALSLIKQFRSNSPVSVLNRLTLVLLIFDLQTERWINLGKIIDFSEWKAINKNHDAFVIHQKEGKREREK